MIDLRKGRCLHFFYFVRILVRMAFFFFTEHTLRSWYAKSFFDALSAKLRNTHGSVAKQRVGRHDHIHQRRIIRQILRPHKRLRCPKRYRGLHGSGGDAARISAVDVLFFRRSTDAPARSWHVKRGARTGLGGIGFLLIRSGLVFNTPGGRR